MLPAVASGRTLPRAHGCPPSGRPSPGPSAAAQAQNHFGPLRTGPGLGARRAGTIPAPGGVPAGPARGVTAAAAVGDVPPAIPVIAVRHVSINIGLVGGRGRRGGSRRGAAAGGLPADGRLEGVQLRRNATSRQP